MAARTENGRKAFVCRPGHEVARRKTSTSCAWWTAREAYAADVTYGTNNEFGFDYLRDNMAMRLEDRVQRGHYYAIVDEVDNILIDEARTPLIISGPAQDDLEMYVKMAAGRQAAGAGGLRGQRKGPHRLADRDRRGACRAAAGPAAARPRPPGRHHPGAGAPAGLPRAGPAGASTSSSATRITWSRAARWSSWTSSPGA